MGGWVTQKAEPTPFKTQKLRSWKDPPPPQRIWSGAKPWSDWIFRIKKTGENEEKNNTNRKISSSKTVHWISDQNFIFDQHFRFYYFFPFFSRFFLLKIQSQGPPRNLQSSRRGENTSTRSALLCPGRWSSSWIPVGSLVESQSMACAVGLAQHLPWVYNEYFVKMFLGFWGFS